MAKIVQQGNPVLREIAKEVPLSDIPSKKIKKVLADMKKALAGEKDGVAIAAPQIGVPLRIFVAAGKVFGNPKDAAQSEGKREEKTREPDRVFINPIIVKKSRKKEEMWEGCLSVHGKNDGRLFGKILRHPKATVTAYDGRGKKFTLGAGGLLAEIFQHEIDHLNGILFIDNAYDVEELPKDLEERQKRVKSLRSVP